MNSKQRLIEYAGHLDLPKRRFAMSAGLSETFLDSGDSISSDKLKLVLDHYPRLSVEWVILGIGKMETPGAAELEKKLPATQGDINTVGKVVDDMILELRKWQNKVLQMEKEIKNLAGSRKSAT